VPTQEAPQASFWAGATSPASAFSNTPPWQLELVVHLRAPRIHSRIQKLQPHLSFLLRSRFADPYHVALRNIQCVLVWDDLDNLSVFQSESSHESVAFCRAIDYEAGKPFRNSFKIDDKTGTFFTDKPL
jgi:hypothetical protein